MKKTFLMSASAIALIAGGTLAMAQGAGREAPSPAPNAQQSAPAEKMAPSPNGAQQRAPESGTTGQGSPQRMEQDRPQGAQSPSGARDQERMKSGDPKSEPRARDSKSDDKGSTTKGAKDQGSKQQSTTGQGAAATGANLTAEQRTKISTSIKKVNVRPVTNVNFNVSVGTVVPRTIELHPLPTTIVEVYPAWRGYRFVLVADEIIIIEPSSYKIVAVIDA